MSNEFLGWFIDSVLGLWPLFLLVLGIAFVYAFLVGFIRAWRNSG